MPFGQCSAICSIQAPKIVSGTRPERGIKSDLDWAILGMTRQKPVRNDMFRPDPSDRNTQKISVSTISL